jgi:very-short-patch-repair endonuclease
MLDSVLRRLARDQWVRLHGTPRVTVLVGDQRGRAIWEQWLALAELKGTLLEGEFEDRVREAVALALDHPMQPIAVLVSEAAASRWRAGRRDRLAALVDEGWIVVDDPGRPAAQGSPLEPCPTPDLPVRGPGGVRVGVDARSAAEATLFEALEATPTTAGRFQLNASLSVRFGSRAAEIDLLSRADRIAIEIDGVHHFADLDHYRRDRRKDLVLQTHGFIVVRLLAEDVMRDVRSAVNAVCQVLAYRLEERAR